MTFYLKLDFEVPPHPDYPQCADGTAMAEVLRRQATWLDRFPHLPTSHRVHDQDGNRVIGSLTIQAGEEEAEGKDKQA